MRTNAIPLSVTSRIAGMRTIGLRGYPFMSKAGKKLLRRESFDAVLFSTTQFAVLNLGPSWLRRFKVPYVLDFQDPWLSDNHETFANSKPPGGSIKYGFSQWLARRWEPQVVRQCAHAICVSPAYPPMFLRRYPDVEPSRFTVLPFGFDERDF